MGNPTQLCCGKWSARLFSVQLVDLNKLKHHENVDLLHLEELREEIESDGILKLPIAVDLNTDIILDGEHRFNALEQLGCKHIPVIFVDYHSPNIIVHNWRRGEQLIKKDVIRAGLSGNKFPPTTTKHMIKINNRLKHISIIEKRVDISLDELK